MGVNKTAHALFEIRVSCYRNQHIKKQSRITKVEDPSKIEINV